MSARLLTRCLAPAALLAAALLVPGVARPAEPKLVPCTYQVADLVIPVPNGPCLLDLKGGSATLAPGAPSCTTGAAPGNTLEEQLIRLITSAVAPRSWADKGGPGTIDYHPMTMSLVINQTPEVQERIAELLAALRRMQDQEVAVEVRIVSVGEDFFERLGIDFSTNPPTKCGAAKPGGEPREGVAFLKDGEVRQFMEAVQGDRRTNVMQAPKLTLFNGQSSVLRIVDEQFFVTGVDVLNEGGQVVARPRTETIPLGLQMGVQPVISADRRSVRINLALSLSNVAAEVPLFPVTMPLKPADGGEPVVFTQFVQQPAVTVKGLQRTVVVPDGGTVLLDGWKSVREVRNEYGPPVLSKVPYVNRLFKNIGYSRESEHVVVLVTPRIIVNEEEEAKKPATACPCPCPCDAPCTCPCPAKCTAKSACCCEAQAPCCATKAKVAALMKRFNELFRQGCYQEAEACAAKAHELDPDSGAAAAAVHMARARARHHGDLAPEAKDRTVAELLRRYYQTCAKARALAERALAIDPTCFSKNKGGEEQAEHHDDE